MFLPRFAYHEIDEALVVADSASGTAMVLNPSAAITWLALTETSRSEAALAELLTRYFPDAARCRDPGVLSLLDTWERKGWCRQGPTGQWSIIDTANTDSDPTPTTPAYADWPAQGARLIRALDIGLDESVLRFEIWASAASITSPAIDRLQGFMGGLPAATRPTTTCFALWIDEPACHLFLDGAKRTTATVMEASGFLYQAFIARAYPDGRAPITLHAAAVATPRGAIIMPALSGSGKSTLTAWLLAQGWRYGGDDIVGIARAQAPDESLRLLPLPTALGIKHGSWPLLAEDFPELPALTVVRYDDKQVRYLPVPLADHIPTDAAGRRPVAIICPQYAADAACSLTRMSEAEALGLILAAGSGAGAAIDLDGFATLIDLIRSVPCHRLVYDSLEEAGRMLDRFR